MNSTLLQPLVAAPTVALTVTIVPTRLASQRPVSGGHHR